MRPLRALAASLALAAIAAAPAHATGWTTYDRPEQNGVVTDHDVWITTRDGTKLSANVDRPDTPGRYPVIVTQTPYGKDGAAGAVLGGGASSLVKRGYVQVTVDVRGTGASQGQWDSFGPSEQSDGYDVVEWAAVQPWSDGKVGLAGPSYMGLNQLYTAALRPPHLKAIFPIVPMADGYRDIVFSGGDINLGFIPLWLGLVSAGGITTPPQAAGGNAANAGESLATLLPHVLGIPNFQSSIVLQSMAGGDVAYDGPFWRTRSPLEVVDRIRVPAFIVGGLHDIFQRGEPLIYERLKRHVPARLLIGPWTHVDGSMGKGLPAPGLPATFDQLELRWFDHWLKGIDTKVSSIPKVTQYVLGGGRYEVQPDWPDPRLSPRRMYLRGGGRLAADAPARSEAAQGFTEQPLSGLCTQSTAQWTAGLGAALPCTTDNSLDERLGEATYTTPPLTQPLRLSGPVLANVWITTTARDAPITVRLTDVGPDGRSTELTDGWLAASFRAVDRSRSRVVGGQLLQPWHPFTRASVAPVTPGTPVELPIEVFPTNAVLPPGHRLRVVVAPSDFPHQVPPGPQLANALAGQVQVLTDPAHPSYVALPELGDACAVPAVRAKGARRRGRVRATRCRALPVPRLVRR